MKRFGLVVLLASLLFCQGCVLGMAALIRWDQRRYKAQQEKLREEEAKRAGGGDTIDGSSAVSEVQEPSTKDTEEDGVPVQPPVVER